MQKLGIINSASRNLFEGKIKDVIVLIFLVDYTATTLSNDTNCK